MIYYHFYIMISSLYLLSFLHHDQQSVSVTMTVVFFMSDETPPVVTAFCLLLPGTLVNIHLFHVAFHCIIKPQPVPPLVPLSFRKLGIQDLVAQTLMIHPVQVAKPS